MREIKFRGKIVGSETGIYELDHIFGDLIVITSYSIHYTKLYDENRRVHSFFQWNAANKFYGCRGLGIIHPLRIDHPTAHRNNFV